MCETCGCGGHDAHDHAHDRDHDHDHDHAHDHDHETGPERDRRARVLSVQRDVLSLNAHHASRNRERLQTHGVVALNVIGSPGSGKTSLLEATISRVTGSRPVVVVEGDLQTDHDAARIRRTGAAAVHQINTGEGCHLDAHMVGHALDRVPLPRGAILFIENVGNLVCPAAFDLGESHRVTVLSVAEGDDKVEKYPIAFRGSSALVISKVDLLAHVDFSVERCREVARRLEPGIAIFELCARTGEGMEAWCDWVLQTAR